MLFDDLLQPPGRRKLLGVLFELDLDGRASVIFVGGSKGEISGAFRRPFVAL